MIFAGIDYSMSSPCICVWDSNTELKFENCLVYNFGNWSGVKRFEGTHENICILKQPTFTCNEERFRNISNWAKAVMIENKVDSVSIEGYSYGSKGSVFEIGENTGVLKGMLFSMKIPFYILEPTHVKKVSSGNGAAKKSLLYQVFKERTGISIERIIGYDSNTTKKNLDEPWELKPVDDIIDSYFILECHPDIRNV